nr:cytochrome c biogenesis protein CcdA [Candidatus Eremiobacteraeota bacterium]
MTSNLNILTAFLAGLLSFVSPCVLPLIPAYLSFLTGSSVEE